MINLNGKKESVSIICGCMNRQNYLQQSLSTWLKLKEVDEIVIVDWNSTIYVHKIIENITDSRIVIIRVNEQKHWIASWSHNLGCKMVSGEILLKVDSDHMIKDSFFENHPINKNRFYCGHHEPNWCEMNSNHLFGAIYVHKDNFFKVNGYNERIVAYGHEDFDLYQRLENSGLERLKIDYDTCEHIPHDFISRIENQPIKNIAPDPRTSMDVSNNRNKQHCTWNPWTIKDRLAEWKVLNKFGRVTTVQKIS